MTAARNPEIASLRRRALAAAVDGLVVIGGFGGVVMSVVKLSGRRRRRARREPGSPPSGRAATVRRRGGELARSTPGRVALRAASLAFVGVPLRNWRSPGARLAGIRVVDARTGGPVSVRSALVADAVGVAFGVVVKALTAPLRRRAEADQARVRALQPELRALQHEHAGDPAAQQRAVMEFYAARDIDPSVSCLPLYATLLMPLSAFLSRRRQTLAQRLAGTLVIRDR